MSVSGVQPFLGNGQVRFHSETHPFRDTQETIIMTMDGTAQQVTARKNGLQVGLLEQVPDLEEEGLFSAEALLCIPATNVID